MQFLANENFPNPSIRILRASGFDVKSIAEEMPGITDKTVVEIARETHRTILTFDKDYGELIFKYGMASPPTVIFFRYKGVLPGFAGEFLLKMLTEKLISLEDNFTVIEEQNIRQRRYQ